jgi:SAM-dependent methyltransferase
MRSARRGAARDPVYPLSRSEQEYARLVEQARWYNASTIKLFREARIGPGMRVLDVGSGVGDVALMLADLVQGSGEVVGIEKDPGALRRARERIRARRLRNVRFVRGDFRSRNVGSGFDAAVGRFVLMYQRDPAEALGRVAARVKPGGVVVFQEFDFTHPPTCAPRLPLFEKYSGVAMEANRRAGVHMQMGLSLYSVFREAGLLPPKLRIDTFVGYGPDFPGCDVLAESIRSLGPALKRFGMAAGETRRDGTLARRLHDEMARRNGVVLWVPVVGAWTARSSVPGRSRPVRSAA